LSYSHRRFDYSNCAAPFVGVITPQLENGSTRNSAGESGW